MCDPYFGLPLTGFPGGHVPWDGTTVNPVDVLLTQPSRGVAQSDGMPENVVTSQDIVGFPVGGVPQEILQHHPVQLPQSMTHPLGLIPDSHNGFTKQFTGAMGRVYCQRFRGVRVGDTVPVTCQWQSQGLSICGQEVTGTTAPTHLASHGIHKLRRDITVQCCWRECGALMKRQSLTRHFREAHLGLKRKTCAFTSPTTLVAHAF